MSIIIKRPSAVTSSQGSRGPRGRIPGVFPGTQFGEQVVSTGIPSLDGYIGGGILLGSIFLLKDDYPSQYADLILKYFLAEGASYNHHLFVASGRMESSKFAGELPSLKKDREARKQESGSTVSSSKDDTDKMKIAWRYKDAAPLPVTLSSRGGVIKGQKLAKFEFTKRATVADLGGTHLHASKLEPSDDFIPPFPVSLIREIADVARLFDLNNSDPIPPANVSNNLLRIALSHCESQVLDINFIFGLRAIVQSTNSCAVITLSNLSCDPKLLARVEQMADVVIQFENILDKKKKEELGDVDGLCKVQKMNSINALKLFIPPSDLGFSYRKKRITFQELHLPPEGENTAQREVGHAKSSHSHPQLSAPGSSCGSTIRGTALDF